MKDLSELIGRVFRSLPNIFSYSKENFRHDYILFQIFNYLSVTFTHQDFQDFHSRIFKYSFFFIVLQSSSSINFFVRVYFSDVKVDAEKNKKKLVLNQSEFIITYEFLRTGYFLLFNYSKTC